MRRILAGATLIAVAVVAFAGCAAADRPEGTVERFAETVSRGVDTELIDELGSREAADELIGEPFVPSDTNQELLDSIEVAPALSEEADSARVPIQVAREDGTEVDLEAILTRRDGAWHVAEFESLTTDVTFPGEGGPGIVEDNVRLVVLTGAVVLGSLLLTTVMIRLVGGRRDEHLEAYERIEAGDT